jgi:hypothetical protein
MGRNKSRVTRVSTENLSETANEKEKQYFIPDAKLFPNSATAATPLTPDSILVRAQARLPTIAMKPGLLSDLDVLFHYLVHGIAYILHFPHRFLLALYLATYGRRAGEVEVVTFILETSLYLLARKDGENFKVQANHSRLHITRSDRGHFDFKSFKMVFAVKPYRVIEFKINGKRTVDYDEMLSALVMYHVSSQHPKLHSASENVINYIAQNRIEHLYPSLRFTRGNSHSVLVNPLSALEYTTPYLDLPIPYKLPLTVQSAAEEMGQWSDFRHSGINLFLDERFPRFMFEARKIVLKHCGLPAPYNEYFFLHTVCHSIDHYNTNCHLKGRLVLM